MSSVDNAIEKTEEVIEEAQKLKKGLMQQLLTKGIGHSEFKEIQVGIIKYQAPINWRLVRFKDLLNEKVISKIQDGNHGSVHPKVDDFVQEGIPFITSDCLSKGFVDLSKAKKLDESYLDKLRIGFSKPNDVLLTHKGSIGYTAIVPNNVEQVILSPQVTYYRIKEEDKLDKMYLRYAFESNYFQSRMKVLAPQSTRDYVGITAQKEMQILLPPLKEQKKIASILLSVDNKIQKEQEYKESLQQLKKGLMQKLLTGEVRVKVEEEVS